MANGDRSRRFPHPEGPDEALGLLEEGNRRHRKGELRLNDYSPVGDRRAEDQKPFAAIITCADSRLSPTLIFDVERGNIFVSRVAGNSIDSGTLGSTEYAVEVIGAKLVMVLGHSDCGAVKAALAVSDGTASYPSESHGTIGEVVDRVVRPLQGLPPGERSLDNCIALNARAQAADLAARGPIIAPAVEAGQLRVVAAVYDIETGEMSLV